MAPSAGLSVKAIRAVSKPSELPIADSKLSLMHLRPVEALQFSPAVDTSEDLCMSKFMEEGW